MNQVAVAVVSATISRIMPNQTFPMVDWRVTIVVPPRVGKSLLTYENLVLIQVQLNSKMVVCLCKKVTSKEIQEAIDNGCTNVQQVIDVTCACTCCGSCRDAIQKAFQKHSENDEKKQRNIRCYC